MKFFNNRLIRIPIKYYLKKGKTKVEQKFTIEEDEEKEIALLSQGWEKNYIDTDWTLPTWGEIRIINSICKQGNSFNNVLYRDQKIKRFLKRWDISDEQQKIIPITNDSIDSLPADLAARFVEEFDKISDPKIENIQSVATAYFKGQKLPPNSDDYLPYLYENIIMEHYGGMNIENVRNMNESDFEIHLRICLAKEDVEREFQMNVHGAGSKSQPDNSVRKIKGGGATKDTLVERISINKPLTEADLI